MLGVTTLFCNVFCNSVMFRLDVVCSVVFTQPSHILYTSRWHSPQLARQGRPRHCRPGGPATDSAARGEGTPTRSIRQQGGRMNGNDPHLSQPVPFQQPELPPFRLADLTAGSHVDSPDPHPDLIDSPDLADPAVSRGAQQHPDLAERSTPPHPEQPPAASMVGTQALDPWNAPPGDSFASPPPVWEKPAASVEGFTQVWDSVSPAPVWEQRPVQDPELEGERVLHDLETLAPTHLFTQVGLTVSPPPLLSLSWRGSMCCTTSRPSRPPTYSHRRV